LAISIGGGASLREATNSGMNRVNKLRDTHSESLGISIVEEELDWELRGNVMIYTYFRWRRGRYEFK
jgi:hypothetical protein